MLFLSNLSIQHLCRCNPKFFNLTSSVFNSACFWSQLNEFHHSLACRYFSWSLWSHFCLILFLSSESIPLYTAVNRTQPSSLQYFSPGGTNFQQSILIISFPVFVSLC